MPCLRECEVRTAAEKAAYKRAWYRRNKEHCKAYARKYYAENRERYRKWYSRKSPESKKAHGILRHARDKGEIAPEPCLICGTGQNLEAHHENYDKPLEVVWLCRSHHKLLHAGHFSLLRLEC